MASDTLEERASDAVDTLNLGCGCCSSHGPGDVANLLVAFAKAERIRFAEKALRAAVNHECVDVPSDTKRLVIAEAIAAAEEDDE